MRTRKFGFVPQQWRGLAKHGLRITVAVADPLNLIAGAGALLPNSRIRALLGKA